MKHKAYRAAGILLSAALFICLAGCGKGKNSESSTDSAGTDVPATTAVSAGTDAAETTALTTVTTGKPEAASGTVTTAVTVDNELPILPPGTAAPGEELPLMTIPAETAPPETAPAASEPTATTAAPPAITIPSTGIELPFVPFT